jgi:hypothetical protein
MTLRIPRALAMLPFVAVLVGCATGLSPGLREGFTTDKLRAEGKSVVLLHTTLHEQRCDFVQAVLSQPNAEGHHVIGERLNIKSAYEFDQVPSQVMLSPGEYGIVELTCIRYRYRASVAAPVRERGSVWDGSGRVYERPIVSFKVGNGEVVDIGSLRMMRSPGVGRSGLTAVVAPIPDPLLQNLAAKNPELMKARISRPMVGGGPV